MPSEIRHVVFRNVEVARAVRTYLERTGTVVPQGELLDCTLECDAPGQEVRFSMTIRAKGPEGVKPVTLRVAGAALAAAIILFCRSENIPLPASASKSLALFGESLCLVVTHNPKGVALPRGLQKIAALG